MNKWRFWRETLERSVKTAAQSVLLGLGFSDVGFANLFDMDPMLALGFAGGGAALSVLTSLATLPMGADDSPSAIE